MTVKNARASRALRRVLDPGQYWLALLTRLCFATSAKSWKKFLGPPPLDQILDPLVGCNYFMIPKSRVKLILLPDAIFRNNWSMSAKNNYLRLCNDLYDLLQNSEAGKALRRDFDNHCM